MYYLLSKFLKTLFFPADLRKLNISEDLLLITGLAEFSVKYNFKETKNREMISIYAILIF